jgi:hypothetical protein
LYFVQEFDINTVRTVSKRDAGSPEAPDRSFTRR